MDFRNPNDTFLTSPTGLARWNNDSNSSISTTATAPNLPGAGRTVGLAIDRLGTRFESFLNTRAPRLGRRPKTTPQNTRRSGQGREIPITRHDSISSVSTDATAPNLPGAGRTVGLLMDFLGSHLELFLNLRARHLGLGPEAIAQEIRRLRRHHETSILQRHEVSTVQLTRVEAQTLKKLCKRLLKYARCVLRELKVDIFLTV